jgi:hypothetical protein
MWVFWVYESNTVRLEEAYRDIADKLELLGQQNRTINVIQLVVKWLANEASGRWLMTVDNVD